jgi:hypothetical protein
LTSLPEVTQQHLTSIYIESATHNSPDSDLGETDLAPQPDSELLQDEKLPDPVTEALSSNTEIDISLSTVSKSPQVRQKPQGGKQDRQIAAWASIFSAQATWCATNGHNKRVVCDIAFADAYMARQIELDDSVYEAVPKLSRSTIARKRTENKRQGVTGLANKDATGRPKS